MMEMSFETFKVMTRRQLNLDFTGYRDNQLQRRLNSYMQKQGFGDYPSLLKFLQQNPREISTFRDYLAINVSEFFRNPDMFNFLAEHVFPGLTRNGMGRIWSAGCSIGCEAYSMAILAAEQNYDSNWSIIATDIDEAALSAAKAGLYEPELMKHVPKNYLSKYFKASDAGKIEVEPRLKNHIRYQQHNLLQDSYPTGMDLIACRNVVIYFTENAKAEIFRRMCSSLRSGGVLFIGATESFHDYQDFKLKRLYPCIYQKE